MRNLQREQEHTAALLSEGRLRMDFVLLLKVLEERMVSNQEAGGVAL